MKEYKRKVLIGTPTLDGKLDVWYCNSLLQTVKMGEELGVFVHAIYPSYDSLLQRSRNSLVKLALEQEFDDLFFIDSDVEWNPEWVFNVLNTPEPVVGGSLVKKSDTKEGYTVRLNSNEITYNSTKTLIEVTGVGTGFLKVSKFALQKLWDKCTPYFDETGEHRMIFDITIDKNGELVSEDYTMCNTWREMGYKVWLDPTITCNHIGVKKWEGNFASFLKKHTSTINE